MRQLTRLMGAYVYANEKESLVNNLNPAYHEVELNVIEGTMEFGLQIVENTTHWVGIDNASIRYYGYNVGVTC